MKRCIVVTTREGQFLGVYKTLKYIASVYGIPYKTLTSQFYRKKEYKSKELHVFRQVFVG